MNRRESQSLRLRQLTETVQANTPLRKVPNRPAGGWLRSVRQAFGISYAALGKIAGKSSQSVYAFEKSEAAGTISLRQLDHMAAALGCRVVYALVPQGGSFEEIAASVQNWGLPSVEHSMALEGQAHSRSRRTN